MNPLPVETIMVYEQAQTINLSNITTCVPVEQVVYMIPNLTLKTDAMKLGVYCFVAGMLVMVAFNYLEFRWKK